MVGNVHFSIPFLVMSGADTLPPAACAPLILIILTMEASSLCFRRGDHGTKARRSESFPSTTISRRSLPGCAGTSKVPLPRLANNAREKIGVSTLQDQPSPDLQCNGGFERHQLMCERVVLWLHSGQAHSVSFRHWPPIRQPPPNARPGKRSPN